MKKTGTLLVILCFVFSLFTVAVQAQSSALYIKAEDFASHLGTWQLVTPAQDTAGGGMFNSLKSPKPGTPESAGVTFEIPEAGSYTVSAFTRDFATSTGSRTFKISVNGTMLENKLGDHATDGWAWEIAGQIELSQGKCTVEVVDSSRNYGRCIAVALSTDPDYSYPTSEAALKEAFETCGITPLAYTPPAELPNLPKPEEPQQPALPTYIPENILVQDTRPQDEIAVKLNGKYLVFAEDSKPFTLNDRTLVPFRALFEALGCKVDWEEETQTAYGTREEIKIRIPVGNSIAYVSENPVYLDQCAVMQQDRVMVPLRFVAESLNAAVEWNDAAQEVIVYADIPQISAADTYLLLPSSFTTLGTWTQSAASSNCFETGMLTGGSNNDPASTTPAKAYIDIDSAGTYTVWVRSRDYANNQPGTRFFNISVNGTVLSPTFGTHGKDGHAWENGGTVTLPAGVTELDMLDTANFYGRCDAVLLTKDAQYTPSDTLDALLESSKLVVKKALLQDYAFPAYAKETEETLSSASISNGQLRADLYTVQTSGGTVVQSALYCQAGADWIPTKARTEDFGLILLSADRAALERPLLGAQIFNTAYTDAYGNLQQYYGSNVYRAGKFEYLLPSAVTVENNTAVLTYTNEALDITLTLSLADTAYIYRINAVYKADGAYSIGIFEGGALSALAVADTSNVSPDSGAMTLGQQGVYTTLSGGVQKGICTDVQSGIVLRDPKGNFRATAFFPVLGSPESYKHAGEQEAYTGKIISSVQ